MTKPEQTENEKAQWFTPAHLEYHARQFKELYRSTAYLKTFVRKILGDCTVPYHALDACCGAAANIFHLSKVLSHTTWTGVDISPEVLRLGERLIAEQGEIAHDVRLVEGDLYRLAEILTPQSFDLVFSLQTLSWLPSYEAAVASCLRMVKPDGGVLFVTSLFTDCLVDIKSEVTEYDEGKFDGSLGKSFYNVYCFDRFRDHCVKLGAREVIATDFIIDIDLPVPTHRRMETFTVAVKDGGRLQFSGPLVLPWKFVAIKM